MNDNMGSGTKACGRGCCAGTKEGERTYYSATHRGVNSLRLDLISVRHDLCLDVLGALSVGGYQADGKTRTSFKCEIARLRDGG
jgi:hypothetical protein